MTSLFIPIKFKTQVQMSPSELDENFEETLLHKLQSTYEGVCSRFGYIKYGSIQIMERSVGQLMKPHFNGHIRFELSVIAEVCNPVEGMVVTAIIKNRNQLGVLAESYTQIGDKRIPVLDIIIPKRTAGITSEIVLDNLNIGDSVYVEILGKRYQLNDKKISIIGRGVQSIRPIRRNQEELSGLIDKRDDESEEEIDEGETELTDEELESDEEDSVKDVHRAEIPFIEEENLFDLADEESLEDLEEEEYEEEDDDFVDDGGDDS